MMQDVKVGDEVILESYGQFLPMEDSDWAEGKNMPLNTPIEITDIEDKRSWKSGGIWVKLLGYRFWHPLPKFKIKKHE